MPVVSNTSPLFNLAAIDQLSLLRHAFAEILIPDAVLHELEPVREYPGVRAIHKAIAQGWIVVSTPRDVSRIRILEQDLGRGEAAAIALALELGLRRILIDERDGSRMAEQSGLEPVGILGILLRAKREGLLDSVKEMMISLRDEVGFYIHQNLFQKVLHLAEED
jgi:predicted nucleic acid-binding protein